MTPLVWACSRAAHTCRAIDRILPFEQGFERLQTMLWLHGICLSDLTEKGQRMKRMKRMKQIKQVQYNANDC